MARVQAGTVSTQAPPQPTALDAQAVRMGRTSAVRRAHRQGVRPFQRLDQFRNRILELGPIRCARHATEATGLVGRPAPQPVAESPSPAVRHPGWPPIAAMNSACCSWRGRPASARGWTRADGPHTSTPSTLDLLLRCRQPEPNRPPRRSECAQPTSSARNATGCL